MSLIIRRVQFSESTFLWELAAPEIARAAHPGQFVMVRTRADGERIPLTLADYDGERGTITLVIQAVGRSTREMLEQLRVGDEVLDVAGPLGLPSHAPTVGHVAMVGGGLGVAPVFPQLRAMKQAGNRVTAILGFRTEALVFWEEEFARWADRVIVCTDDGSYGSPGLVTDALARLVHEDRPDLVVAIGPLGMMRACAAVARPIPTMVSLNAIMVDGTGMCGSCRVTVDGQVRFACVDGPDFPAHGVDFDELIRRQARFLDHERAATADRDHVCHLEQQLFTQGRRNYKKIAELEPHATPMPERPAEARSRTFDEVSLGYDLSSALFEAERCIQCKKPTCVAGCPVQIDIPRFIRHLLVRDLDGAAEVIRENNLFPSICGRVCAQESQCEAQCIIGKKVEPVAIGRLERFVGDHAAPARPARGANRGRVAVVGSGPSGLACAADLARAGAEVVIYEALHVVGGVLRYGIPAFRLPRDILDREIAQLAALGVTIETNRIIGRTFSVDQLLSTHDAVFLGVGAGYPSFLGIPGENAGRSYSANEFLTRVNLMGGDRFPFQATPVAIGRSVVVVGAGNTAMDCLRVARRLGAVEVTCVYRRTEEEAPARREELRHAKEEGVRFRWLRSPTAIVTNPAGDVVGIRLEVMRLGEPDAGGRRKPEPTGEIEELVCDTVVTALGTRANPILSQTTPGLRTHHGGYFEADARSQATSLPGVFAGGDIVTGGATVILALGAGRRAAKGILAWLDARVWPPVVAEEAPREEPAGVAGPVCPSCHRPVEDTEGYVCCAGASLHWTCTACHKRYDGFAFPYGLCPACGGRLELGEAGTADEAAIRAAFQIELAGMVFYGEGAKRATDPEVCGLFSRLAAMEHAHLATLTRRYHVESPRADPGAVPFFLGVEPPMGDPLGLLRLAVELERRAQAFFTERAGQHADGSPAWRLYRELAAEEDEHVVMLELELARRERGLAGML